MAYKLILGIEKLTTDRFVIPKSRYASVSSYLTEENQNFNDIKEGFGLQNKKWHFKDETLLFFFSTYTDPFTEACYR